MENLRQRYFPPIHLILLLGFALRQIDLVGREIWYDDAFSIFLARRDLLSIGRGTAADTMPPLYYAMLHFWMQIGSDPFTLRFLSVILSTLIVAVAFALARRVLGDKGGLYAALFTAIAPFQIYHAQELRMYALLALALLGYWFAFFSFWRGEQRDRPDWRALFGVFLFGTLALYSHNLAFATLIVPDLFLVALRAWRSLGKLILAQFGSLLFFAPWLLYVPGQVEKIQRAFWTGRPGLVDVLQALLAFTTNLPVPTWFLPISLFAALAIATLSTMQLVRAFRRGAPVELGLVLGFAVIPPLVVFGLSYLIRPVFVPRGIILSSLAYYMILGWAAARAPRPVRVAALVLAGIIIGAALFFQYTYNEFPRSPFQQADAFLSRNVAPGDVILHDNKLAFFPMHYYAPQMSQSFLPDPKDSDNDTLAQPTMEVMDLFPTTLEQTAAGKQRVWFVIFKRALDEAAEKGQPHGNKTWLDNHFASAAVTRFNDLDIYLYQR